MVSPKSVEKWLDKLPVDKDDVMAYGVSLFLTELNPDNIEMKWYENGWQLTVKTDEESASKMREFWEQNIEPRL